MDRRFVLAGLGAAALAIPARGLFAAPTPLRMWRSPGCGCCLEWVKRVEAHFGRRMIVTDMQDMAAVKRARGVPPELQSCHTALIDGVVVEGHVPPADVSRLIASGNKSIVGLAVPGMPAGAPGMDVGHDHKVPYNVHGFTAKGTHSVFASHGS